MSQERGFLDAIWDEPDEDVHRLAYADWLNECDDQARQDRDEFIHLH